ncbi:G patch domain-containing protein 11 [Cephus cinctus]|uniref:G patch domain-containing protein 11 n=1 Tax=Cephus cinctus TaxID=211228 RepID=A0AAJ7FHM6_CEPCN|nr:G patch domain-containing protein 11 [Cephus cinctus]XP_015592306.1 G patch domain-containing protein 11 [Cephus cinctus]XP_015592307.1 G patch domain-containing protein 11 [Cephus cinctus]XP_015592308.1 G patch domain-containing protein 11 [Cephus cinctus]XP_024939407.1 G patch domain-containing protein 11 [Cephus cinctus]XP_024939408.1 G patch domain-containing protein 11 [Cephus cinctus]
MSDEEDYMSDKFLQGTEKYIAPSLIHRHADKRELELLKKKAEIEARLKEKNKSVRAIEEEKREEGLSSAISSNNKGFEMLMKMGYKPGQGIGKRETGISEPISVDVKANRFGLGKNPKKKLTSKNKKPESKLEDLNTDDFRGRIAQKKSEHLTEADLYKSQKVCEQLDTQNQIETPTELWFWPAKQQTKGSDDETDNDEDEEVQEQEELAASEKLEILTKYLRDKYSYCLWCGAAYDDEDDLRDNCPGTTRDDH